MSESASPDSPISSRVVKEAPTIATPVARDRAVAFLGTPAETSVSHAVVRVTDRADLGHPIRDRLAHSFYFEGIELRRSLDEHAEMTHLNLFVIVDAATAELVLAYTASKPEWIERTDSVRSMDENARTVGWTLLPADGDGLRSTIVQVLQAAYAQYRVIADAAQVIVRPRWIEQKFPARREGDTLVPLRAPANAWLVHTMGCLVGYGSAPAPVNSMCGTDSVDRSRESPMLTQMMILVADSSLVVGPSSLLP